MIRATHDHERTRAAPSTAAGCVGAERRVRRGSAYQPPGQAKAVAGAATITAMNPTHRLTRLLSLSVATGAVALAGPVAGASAWTMPAATASTLPAATTSTLPVFTLPAGFGNAVGGNQIGQAGCVGTNRPSVGGNNGSTSAQTCGAILNFSGPQIGQIASVIGPTIIGSPASNVVVSAGPVTYPVQAP